MTISVLAYADIERYFIRGIEVSRQDFMAVDSMLIRESEVWTSSDTTTYIITPDIYARIDSASVPGRIMVVRKSDAEIARIDSIMRAYRVESAKLKVGDKMPPFRLENYDASADNVVRYDDSMHGKVLLLNFWATWCGPCLEELKAAHLPSVVSELSNDERFIFIPVCVNHSRAEIDSFFDTEIGKEFVWLRDIMAWDKNGEFSDRLSDGGIPLTLLIDRNGIIRLNESGAFLNPDDLSRLKTQIRNLLNP